MMFTLSEMSEGVKLLLRKNQIERERDMRNNIHNYKNYRNVVNNYYYLGQNQESYFTGEKEVKDENKSEGKSNGKFLESLKFTATVLIPLLTVLYGFGSFIASYDYIRECSEFYGITKLYFSSYDFNPLFLRYAILCCIGYFYIFPFVYKDRYIKKENDICKTDKISIISIIVSNSIISLLFSLLNFLELLSKSNFRNENEGLISFIDINLSKLFIVHILIILILCFLEWHLITRAPTINKNKINVPVFIFSLLLVVSLAPNLFSIDQIYKFPTEKEANYEFVTTNNSEYVVITHYEDKVLVVPYQCNDDGDYIFYTKNYSFLKPDECTFSYIKLEYLPIINKE